MEQSNKNQTYTNYYCTEYKRNVSDEQKIRKQTKNNRKAYNKAVLILNKIAKNEATGIQDNRDKADKKKYQAVVDEYHKSLNGKCQSVYEESIIQQRILANKLTAKAPTISKDLNIDLNKSSPGNVKNSRYYDCRDGLSKIEKNEVANIRDDKNQVKFGSIHKQTKISGIPSRATYNIPAMSNVSTTAGTRATNDNQINVGKVAKRKRRRRRPYSGYLEAKVDSTNLRPTDQSSGTAITTVSSTASWFMDTERNQQQQKKSKETTIQTYNEPAFNEYIEAKSNKVEEIDIPADDVSTFYPLQFEEIDGALLKSQQDFEELELVLIDEISDNSSRVIENWTSIETRLTELIVEYALYCKNGFMPSFDSAKFRLGFRIIKCDNQFSKDFLHDCVARISDEWPNIRLKLLPFKHIFKTRSKVRIYLPVMKITGEKLLSLLRRQNPDVPMCDWSLLKVEKPHASSMSLLLTATNKSLVSLRNVDYKLKFGIRNATVEVLPSTSAEDNLEIVDERCD